MHSASKRSILAERGVMSDVDELPPTTKEALSVRGWVCLLASLLLGVTLFMAHPALGALYTVFVFAGFLVGMPGGMHYQDDVDAFLSQHPELSRSDLPWPESYEELSREKAWRYTQRGLPGAIVYGFLLPVSLLLAALVDAGVLNEKVLESLYREKGDA
jgi:hypothetical protein